MLHLSLAHVQYPIQYCTATQHISFHWLEYAVSTTDSLLTFVPNESDETGDCGKHAGKQ